MKERHMAIPDARRKRKQRLAAFPLKSASGQAVMPMKNLYNNHNMIFPILQAAPKPYIGKLPHLVKLVSIRKGPIEKRVNWRGLIY